MISDKYWICFICLPKQQKSMSVGKSHHQSRLLLIERMVRKPKNCFEEQFLSVHSDLSNKGETTVKQKIIYGHA